MKFLNKIFKKKDSSDSIKATASQTQDQKGIPVNKSTWLLTHTESVGKEFDFLVTHLGFEITMNKLLGNEFWIVYSRKPIDIQIWSGVDDLPCVQIKNTDMPYDESRQLDNRENVEDHNLKAKDIRQNWSKRRDPIQKRFMDEWLKKNNLDRTELNNDYEQFGKHEHIEYLRQAALTVKEKLEFKNGN